MSDIELDYDGLMQDALKRVVHDVLAITAELGETPGEHHFYIEFLTGAEGVSIPDHLRQSYPTRMTIVLHHQFENLLVTDTGFSISLWFKGIEAQLEIPFDAMTSFADPGAKFGLRFREEEDEEEDGDQAPLPAPDPQRDDISIFPVKNPRKKTKPKIIPGANATKKVEDKSAEKVTEKVDGKKPASPDTPDTKSTDSADADGADIVSLDAFRRK